MKVNNKHIYLYKIVAGAGSCVLKCSDDNLTITLVGWRGTSSLRAYTDTNDTVHMLRLLGADLSKYGKFEFNFKIINKFVNYMNCFFLT